VGCVISGVTRGRQWVAVRLKPAATLFENSFTCGM